MKVKPRAEVIHLRERQRLIVNYDGSETLSIPEKVEPQIRSLVQSFEGSHVGILQRCVGAHRSTLKTNVFDPRFGYQPIIAAGGDPMAIFVDEWHKCGIQAWGSCRMNDGHHTCKGFNYERRWTRFYREHPELRLKEKHEGQVSATYDWNKPEVSTQMLAFLREAAENWDVDGIDLDFSRILPVLQSRRRGAGTRGDEPARARCPCDAGPGRTEEGKMPWAFFNTALPGLHL